MKLGTILLRDAVITLSQLEAALRTQILCGGRLGTSLVEHEFIDLDALGTYLAQILDVPLATQAHFESAPGDLVASFGRERAERYTAFPLGYEAGRGEVLAVALSDPRNEALVDELAASCERTIVPYVAPELRLLYYLEAHYQIPRKARYNRSGVREPAASRAPRPVASPLPGEIDVPPAVRLEPRRRAAKPDETSPAPSPTHDMTGTLSVADATAALGRASRRDQIGEILIQFAKGRFAVTVLFVVRDGRAQGWRFFSAFPNPPPSQAIETLSLPLGALSALQAAHDSGQPYRGSSPSASRRIEKELWTAIQCPGEPRELLIVPVRLQNRVVNLIYAHGQGASVSQSQAEELCEVAQRAGEAYTRIIRAAKATATATPR